MSSYPKTKAKIKEGYGCTKHKSLLSCSILSIPALIFSLLYFLPLLVTHTKNRYTTINAVTTNTASNPGTADEGVGGCWCGYGYSDTYGSSSNTCVKSAGLRSDFRCGIAVDSLCDGVQKEGEKKRMKKEILRRGIFYFLPLKGCGSV